MEIFEVTGTHSKTSTALLLALMLSRQKKVLSHTTRGLEIWQEGKASPSGKGAFHHTRKCDPCRRSRKGPGSAGPDL